MAQNACPENSSIMDYQHSLFPICHWSRDWVFTKRQEDDI